MRKNGWKLHSWTLANKSSKRHWRKTRIYLFYMTLVKQKCTRSASPQSRSKISPSIFPRIGNREQSNVNRFACNLVTQEKLPDIFGLLILGLYLHYICLKISDVYFYNVLWFITSGKDLRWPQILIRVPENVSRLPQLALRKGISEDCLSLWEYMNLI